MSSFDLYSLHAHLIRRLQQLSTSLWTKIVSETITSPQFAILDYLLSHPDCDQTTLGNSLCLDRATTTEIVSRMEQRNLLSRKKDPADLRHWRLALTENGRDKHTELVPLALEHNRLLVATLNKQESERLLSYLQVLCIPAEDGVLTSD